MEMPKYRMVLCTRQGKERAGRMEKGAPTHIRCHVQGRQPVRCCHSHREPGLAHEGQIGNYGCFEFCYTAETNTTLESDFPPIKKQNKEKILSSFSILVIWSLYPFISHPRPRTRLKHPAEIPQCCPCGWTCSFLLTLGQNTHRQRGLSAARGPVPTGGPSPAAAHRSPHPSLPCARLQTACQGVFCLAYLPVRSQHIQNQTQHHYSKNSICDKEASGRIHRFLPC